MQEIADGVLIDTTFRGITVGAIRTEQGFVLIDAPPFPQDAKHWRNTLQSYADIPIYAMIMLDSHRDRMLGASWFRPDLLIAHAATHETVSGLSNSYVSTIAGMLTTSPSEQTTLLAGKILRPNITFTKNIQLHFGDIDLAITHQPGPARGSLWIKCLNRDVLFVGDSLVVDTPPHLNSSYSTDWLKSLENLPTQYPDTIIIPGRGGPSTDKQNIERLIDYLQLARERIQSLYEAQRPLSDSARIIHELLGLYPPPMEHELDEIQQRVRTSLQFIYNEFREIELGLNDDLTDTQEINIEAALVDLMSLELDPLDPDIDGFGRSASDDEEEEEDDFDDFED